MLSTFLSASTSAHMLHSRVALNCNRQQSGVMPTQHACSCENDSPMRDQSLEIVSSWKLFHGWDLLWQQLLKYFLISRKESLTDFYRFFGWTCRLGRQVWTTVSVRLLRWLKHPEQIHIVKTDPEISESESLKWQPLITCVGEYEKNRLRKVDQKGSETLTQRRPQNGLSGPPEKKILKDAYSTSMVCYST